MPDLETLMTLPGAVAAFRFSDRGELLEHRYSEGEGIDRKVLDLLSHMCVANVSIATMQARGWEGLTGMGGFYPIGGFTFVGMDWSAVVRSDWGVVMDNKRADYEAAIKALEG
jgi:roadblock/LC7 domain-containing protein